MVGLSDFSSGIIEPFDDKKHSYALGILEDRLCLINCSTKTLSYQGIQISPNYGIPVHQDMTFEIGSATMIVERI